MLSKVVKSGLGTAVRSGLRTGASSLNLATSMATNYAKKSGVIDENTANRIKQGSSDATTYVNSKVLTKESFDKAADAGKKGIEFVKTAQKDPAEAAKIAAEKAKKLGNDAYAAATNEENLKKAKEMASKAASGFWDMGKKVTSSATAAATAASESANKAVNSTQVKPSIPAQRSRQRTRQSSRQRTRQRTRQSSRQRTRQRTRQSSRQRTRQSSRSYRGGQGEENAIQAQQILQKNPVTTDIVANASPGVTQAVATDPNVAATLASTTPDVVASVVNNPKVAQAAQYATDLKLKAEQLASQAYNQAINDPQIVARAQQAKALADQASTKVSSLISSLTSAANQYYDQASAAATPYYNQASAAAQPYYNQASAAAQPYYNQASAKANQYYDQASTAAKSSWLNPSSWSFVNKTQGGRIHKYKRTHARKSHKRKQTSRQRKRQRQ